MSFVQLHRPTHLVRGFLGVGLLLAFAGVAGVAAPNGVDVVSAVAMLSTKRFHALGDHVCLQLMPDINVFFTP